MKNATKSKRKKRHYTFYERGTDKLLYFGTAEELVEMGYFASTQAVYKLVYHIETGRVKSVEVYAEWLNADEDE